MYSRALLHLLTGYTGPLNLVDVLKPRMCMVLPSPSQLKGPMRVVESFFFRCFMRSHNQITEEFLSVGVVGN